MKLRDSWNRFKDVVLYVENTIRIDLKKLEVVDALINLKKKVIKDFDHLIRRMNKGYTDDYSMILHDISFILVYLTLEKRDRIYEFLMNN